MEKNPWSFWQNSLLLTQPGFSLLQLFHVTMFSTYPGPNEGLWDESDPFSCMEKTWIILWVDGERWYLGWGKVAQAAGLVLRGRMGWGPSHRHAVSQDHILWYSEPISLDDGLLSNKQYSGPRFAEPVATAQWLHAKNIGLVVRNTGSPLGRQEASLRWDAGEDQAKVPCGSGTCTSCPSSFRGEVCSAFYSPSTSLLAKPMPAATLQKRIFLFSDLWFMKPDVPVLFSSSFECMQWTLALQNHQVPDAF